MKKMRFVNALDIPRLREEVFELLPLGEKGEAVIDLRGRKGVLRGK